MLTLDHLKPGVPATVLALVPADDRPGDILVVQRLAAFGFEPGTAVQILHQGPFGGEPLAVEVGVLTVALRRSEAACVRVTL